MAARLSTMNSEQRTTFDEFYAARYAWAVRLAYGLTGDRGVAEQLAQDAFVRMAAKFETVDQPVAYLRTAVVNATRSHGRRLAVERRQAHRTADPSTPDHLVEFVDVLNGLPQRQRTAVVLRYLDGMDDEQIADLLHCRLGTVRSLVSRGLANLREVLK